MKYFSQSFFQYRVCRNKKHGETRIRDGIPVLMKQSFNRIFPVGSSIWRRMWYKSRTFFHIRKKFMRKSASELPKCYKNGEKVSSSIFFTKLKNIFCQAQNLGIFAIHDDSEFCRNQVVLTVLIKRFQKYKELTKIPC